MSYYDNVNPDLLALVDRKSQRILEIGCGMGALARAIKSGNESAYYVGVDISEEALNNARQVLDHSIHCNIDSIPDWDANDDINKVLPKDSLDLAICGDVLEHLYDPDTLVRQIFSRLRSGGQFLVCCPNVQHWTVFAQLVLGSWPRQDAGIFDRTHIRWFTLDDLTAMILGAGFQIESITPRVFNPAEGAAIMEYLEPLAMYLNKDPQEVVERGLALQYVISARRP